MERFIQQIKKVELNVSSMIIFLAAIKKNVPGGNNKGKKRNYEFDVLSSYIATGIENVLIFIKSDNAEKEKGCPHLRLVYIVNGYY